MPKVEPLVLNVLSVQLELRDARSKSSETEINVGGATVGVVGVTGVTGVGMVTGMTVVGVVDVFVSNAATRVASDDNCVAVVIVLPSTTVIWSLIWLE